MDGKRIDRWIDGCMGEQMVGWMDGWMDGKRMEGWIDGWTDQKVLIESPSMQLKMKLAI